MIKGKHSTVEPYRLLTCFYQVKPAKAQRIYTTQNLPFLSPE